MAQVEEAEAVAAMEEAKCYQRQRQDLPRQDLPQCSSRAKGKVSQLGRRELLPWRPPWSERCLS